MNFHPKIMFNIHKHILLPTLLATCLAYTPIYADDSQTINELHSQIAELRTQLGDLERQVEEGGGKTDDENPGARITKEDLERIKEDMRSLRGRSDEMNTLQDELRLLRDDIKRLKQENTELRTQKVHKKESISPDDEDEEPTERKKKEIVKSKHFEDEEPTEKKKSETIKPKHPIAAQKASADLDDETESVLQLLEKSAPVADQEGIGEASSKKQRKNTDVEAVREAATKHAEETAPNLTAGNAEAQYNEAFALYDKGAYKEAERAFSYFIKTYPSDPLVSKAMYWKAESCFQLKNYKSAKILFVNAYKKNPKGPKSADCLLKLGEILAIEGKNDDACTAWRKLKKDFPHMTSEMKTELTTLVNTYGCDLKLDDATKSATKKTKSTSQGEETPKQILKRPRTEPS